MKRRTEEEKGEKQGKEALMLRIFCEEYILLRQTV
jgi:hypothetical protein